MIEEKIIKTINQNNLISKNDKIIIGVSGGPDSICLLHILNKLKNEFEFDIIVAHINHMIRKEAKQDQEYVEDMCKDMKIQCFCKQEDVIKIAQMQKIGTEEAGRNIRYEFFEEVLKQENANKIATAHTANDSAETIIMNLLRGTGINGLKGIEAKRDEKYIRPLIDCKRKEIEEYCKENNLFPKEDKTNKENIYTRNKVRNVVIPYIKEEFNPNIIENLTRLSNIVTEESKYFDKIILDVYNNIVLEKNKKQIVLNMKSFNSLEIVIKRRLVLYTINMVIGHIKGIQKIHIDDIITLCQNNIGNKMLSPIKNLKIEVKNKKIYFISAQ